MIASAAEDTERGRIFIVRHAQSAANAGGRTADQATIPITDTGMRQAQCVADIILVRPTVIAVPRYLRTVQTAAPLVCRYPGAPVEQWRVEEFTYLYSAACAGTTYTRIPSAKVFAMLTGTDEIRSGSTAWAANALPISLGESAGSNVD